jgi:hypothetical protein
VLIQLSAAQQRDRDAAAQGTEYFSRCRWHARVVIPSGSQAGPLGVLG